MAKWIKTSARRHHNVQLSINDKGQKSHCPKFAILIYFSKSLNKIVARQLFFAQKVTPQSWEKIKQTKEIAGELITIRPLIFTGAICQISQRPNLWCVSNNAMEWWHEHLHSLKMCFFRQAYFNCISFILMRLQLCWWVRNVEKEKWIRHCLKSLEHVSV